MSAPMFKERKSGTFLRLLVCTLLSLKASLVAGGGAFTSVPKDVVEVDINENATFVWEYTVQNKLSDFERFSPTWSFYNASGYEFKIGHEVRRNNWAWEVTNPTCPPRLLHPILRVSKKDQATLVIRNVTTADAGTYGCTLALSPPKTSKVELVVIVLPKINRTGETNVTEYTNLTLVCSAVGPPTPNVTWINSKTGVVQGQGVQSATLFIANITREQNGTNFTCKAKNHPTKPNLFVEEVVTVTVKFPPEEPSDRSRYKNNYKVCHCDKEEIPYGATGYPPPTFYWYNPSNESVGENKTGKESKIKVDPIHGNWTCHITNGIGKGIYYRFEMEVLPSNHEDCKHCPKHKDCLRTGEIAGIIIGVLVGVGFIAVIGVVIYKKVKKDDKRISLKALVAVIIAVLLVSGIIVAIIVAILGGCIKAGLVVGITFGVVVGVGIIAVIVVVIYIKKKKG